MILLLNFSLAAISSEKNWVLDARFSTLDIVKMVNNHYPDLSNKAELISHYSGYYSINPFLLSEYVHLYNYEVVEQSKILSNIIHNSNKSTNINPAV